MSDYFIFDGVDSRDFGILVFGGGENYGSPAREYSSYAVPGRSGTLYVDEKRYSNKGHGYDCIIYQDFEENLDNFRGFLMSRTGYKRLEDSLHGQEFYQAVYVDDFLVTVNRQRDMGKFVLQFDRKPQRFLKSGEIGIELTSNDAITNDTLFNAQPLVRIYGTGTVGIADNAITVLNSDDYVDIDCAMMEAYKDGTSYNDAIEIQNINFPVLHPGANGITLGAGITKVIITPRWYKL